MAFLRYSSAYQWARKGFVPAHGERSHKRGNMGQPLFSERQVVFRGVERALNAYHQFQAQRSRVERREPDDGLVYFQGAWYRRV